MTAEGEEHARRMAAAEDQSVLYVKVMTDEQMEVLRRQIYAYTAICERLVEMHKCMTAQQDSLSVCSCGCCVEPFRMMWVDLLLNIHFWSVFYAAPSYIEFICMKGMRLGNIYNDPLVTAASHKISTRQRWTPTPVQLQVLESIFEQGNGTPNKQKIKAIASELSQHGQISETNVYNWFQNRRARSKRKHQASGPNSNNAESEVETEVESPKTKKEKQESVSPRENISLSPKFDEACFHNQEISSGLHSLDSDTGIDHHFMGRMDFPANFNPFRGGFDMIG